jgi:metal-responsive CopG/Arc/MetJ family transcriptional regulator
MKAKTSISLSVPLLVQIDKLIGEHASRSAFIEKVLHDHLRETERLAIQHRDMELINANADYFNREMEDVLKDQDAFYFDLVQDQDHDATLPPSFPECENRPGTAEASVR